MVHHVSLETREADAERCAAFYRLLGFAEVQPPGSLRGRARWLEREGTQVHLLLADDPVVPPRGHVAVEVEDYEDVVAGLRAAGHEVEPRREYWGSPRAYSRDPAGHRVELMAFRPGA